MEFDLLRAGGILALLIAVGVGGLAASNVMTTSTVLMMVLPSTVIFGAIAFVLGVKHGEFRAS
mgnify:CR=1 FL=1